MLIESALSAKKHHIVHLHAVVAFTGRTFASMIAATTMANKMHSRMPAGLLSCPKIIAYVGNSLRGQRRIAIVGLKSLRKILSSIVDAS